MDRVYRVWFLDHARRKYAREDLVGESRDEVLHKFWSDDRLANYRDYRVTRVQLLIKKRDKPCG
jgi:hypothetical protein